MYDKTFSLASFTIVLLQLTVYILPFWKVNDKKDLIKDGFEAFEGLWFRCYRPDGDSLLRCEINTSTSLRLYIIRDLMTTSLFMSISSVVFIVNPFKSVDIMRFVSHHTFRIYITLLALSGTLLFISTFWECTLILSQQTIDWFELGRKNQMRYSPGACIFLGLFTALVQITLALLKGVLDCKSKAYQEGDYV